MAQPDCLLGRYSCSHVLSPLSKSSERFEFIVGQNPFMRRLANIELFMCRAAVLPARIDFDGGEPDILQSVAEKGDSFLQRSLLYSYQESINQNKSFLRQLASTYRVALTVLVVWLICVYLYCFYIAFPKG